PSTIVISVVWTPVVRPAQLAATSTATHSPPDSKVKGSIENHPVGAVKATESRPAPSLRIDNVCGVAASPSQATKVNETASTPIDGAAIASTQDSSEIAVSAFASVASTR